MLPRCLYDYGASTTLFLRLYPDSRRLRSPFAYFEHKRSESVELPDHEDPAEIILRLRLYYIPPHVLLRAVYEQKLTKSQGTRKAHVQCSYPADHTQRPAEEFGHGHNSLHAPCDFRFAVSPQGTCTKKECYPCNILARVASLKWGMRGKNGHQKLTGHVLVSHFTLVFPVLCTCQVSTAYVTRVYQVLVPPGLQEGITEQERVLLHMVHAVRVLK
jgi:hypothetical protein